MLDSMEVDATTWRMMMGKVPQRWHARRMAALWQGRRDAMTMSNRSVRRQVPPCGPELLGAHRVLCTWYLNTHHKRILCPCIRYLGPQQQPCLHPPMLYVFHPKALYQYHCHTPSPKVNPRTGSQLPSPHIRLHPLTASTRLFVIPPPVSPSHQPHLLSTYINFCLLSNKSSA